MNATKRLENCQPRVQASTNAKFNGTLTCRIIQRHFANHYAVEYSPAVVPRRNCDAEASETRVKSWGGVLKVEGGQLRVTINPEPGIIGRLRVALNTTVL